MHPFDLFFEGGEAMIIIFKIGFFPCKEDFVEFSESDYEKYRTEVGEVDGKMFRFVEGKQQNPEAIFVFSELEKDKMLEATEVMKSLAQKHNQLGQTDDETLQYLAEFMPYPFSKGSKYEKFAIQP